MKLCQMMTVMVDTVLVFKAPSTIAARNSVYANSEIEQVTSFAGGSQCNALGLRAVQWTFTDVTDGRATNIDTCTSDLSCDTGFDGVQCSLATGYCDKP